MAASNYSQLVKRGPINTRSVAPTTASNGRLTHGVTYGRAKPYTDPKHIAAQKNVARTRDRKLKQHLLEQLGAAAGGAGGGGAYSALGEFPTGPARKAPKVPLAPTAGNPYKGLETAIGGFARQSAKRQAGDARTARKAMKGRHDPGAGIAGSLNTQLAGQAAETAVQASTLQHKARQQYATADLERQSNLAKAKYDQRSGQMKADMEAAQGSQLSIGMIQQLASEGLDPTAFMGNPIAAAVTLGRLRYARRAETGLPATAWAQAAQYGLQPPNQYGSAEEFYWNLGQARSGQAGGSDAVSLIQALNAAGLLKGLTP